MTNQCKRRIQPFCSISTVNFMFWCLNEKSIIYISIVKLWSEVIGAVRKPRGLMKNTSRYLQQLISKIIRFQGHLFAYTFSWARCASAHVGMTTRYLYATVAEHCGRSSFRTSLENQEIIILKPLHSFSETSH